jgi:PAS domain S-box-containing protein
MYHKQLQEQIDAYFPKEKIGLIEFEDFLKAINKSCYDSQEHVIKSTLIPDHKGGHNNVELKDLLIHIASTYINADTNQIESQVNKSLERIGKFVNADRAYVFDYNFNDNTCSNTFEWCNEGVSKEIENLQKIPLEFVTHWIEFHKANKPFYIPDINLWIDEGADSLKSILESQSIQSLITVPMVNKGELHGFVGFDSVKEKHEYTNEDVKLLFLFAQMLIHVFEKKKREQIILNQEEKYRNIIANMNLGLIEVDNEDTILHVNQTFCNITGYDAIDLIGKKAFEVLYLGERTDLIKEKMDLRRKGSSDIYEIDGVTKQGEQKWFLVSGAPNYNDKNELIGSIGIQLDITKHKQMEIDLAAAKTKAEEAAKAKDIFLANMSHEIRTPLNAIIGIIRELGRENLTIQQLGYVQQGNTAAKHLLTIINNILDISKIEANEFLLEHKEFSLSSVISNIKSILYSRASDKNLKLNVFISPDLAPAHIGDAGRIRQVLLNLVDNAIKFTNEGKVTVFVEVIESNIEEQNLEISIIDTGIGMSEEFLQKVFKKFSQEDNAINRKYEGTGLGLVITRELIHLMGGTCNIASTRNQGTKISINLKLKIGTTNGFLEKREVEIKNSLQGKSVLIVEDNDMNRFIAVQSLKYFGCDVIEAHNGLEAISKVSILPFDLILMDIQMPVMDGIECTRKIREELKLQTPIIALTANAFRKDVETYLSLGMNNYVAKPFEEKVLYDIIQETLLSNAIGKNANTATEYSEYYNLEYIKSISKNDPTFVSKLLEIFIAQTPGQVSDMMTLLASGNYQDIEKITHKLIPIADNLKINLIKDDLLSFEYIMKSGKINTDEITRLVTKISDILMKVVELLEIKLKSGNL